MKRVRNAAGEFLVDESGLTAIPIRQPKKISLLKRIWCRISPEWYCRYKRHKSHMNFLDSLSRLEDGYCAEKPDYVLRRRFGTVSYIFMEKMRVRALPSIETEFNEFDPRMRTHEDRRSSLKDALKAAFKEHGTTP